MMDNAVYKLKNFLEDLSRDKRTLVKILSVILILLLALILRIHGANKADITIEDAPPAESETSEEADSSESDEGSFDAAEIIFIDIGGEVKEPGVYQVAKDTRLYQVIEMAGGLTENADTLSVNQASYVEDGQKVVIPSKEGGISAEEAAEASSSAVSAADSSSGEGLVNINLASKEELKTLNGIGDVMADRIIEYRSSVKFRSKEDIMSVKGIGNATYDKIKDSITC